MKTYIPEGPTLDDAWRISEFEMDGATFIVHHSYDENDDFEYVHVVYRNGEDVEYDTPAFDKIAEAFWARHGCRRRISDRHLDATRQLI